MGKFLTPRFAPLPLSSKGIFLFSTYPSGLPPHKVSRNGGESLKSFLGINGHLEMIQKCENWRPFIFWFIAHPTVRSIYCWVLWLDQVFRKANFIQNSRLYFAALSADDDWWWRGNDNFGREAIWGERQKTKGLLEPAK